VARHFLGLRGAKTVATEHLRLTHHAAADVWAACAMGAVHGPAGLGKTFAVEDALASRRRGEVCWASFPSRPTMRLVSAELWATLSGEPAPRADRFALTARLVEELSTCRRMLVVDEAQRLNRECIEFLRHLHDHPATTFGLLLVGGDGCWDVLTREPMLRSRIYRRVAFGPLTAPQVLEVVRRFHPLYQDATDELVLFVDDNFGHGNFRNWAVFTRTAQSLCTRGRRGFDEDVARNAFLLHGGGKETA
jgi:type II secretory pathway predicted ATPase ExeA